MGLNKPGNVGKIFDSFTLASLLIVPCLDFSTQGVSKGCHPHEDAVNVGWDGPGGEIPVELFGADLDADLRAALQVDRPFKTLLTRAMQRVLRSKYAAKDKHGNGTHNAVPLPLFSVRPGLPGTRNKTV
jgi:hypothetical protein